MTEPQPRSNLHETARRYAAAGLPIFPCRVGSKEPASAHGFHDATTDIGQIDAWWAEEDYNIGLEPEQAGWCVVDIDNLESWENLDENTPATYTVKSPSGGRHLYFHGSLPASAGSLAPGVDTRGRGSYVLVPPSCVNGQSYAVSDNRDPAQIPAWITNRLGHAERVRATAPPNIQFDEPEVIAWAVAEIEADLAERGSPPYDGSTGAYTLINKLLDGRRGSSLSPERMTELLLTHWAPHFDRDWVELKVDNAYKYRQNSPGCGQPFDPERKYGDPSQYPQPSISVSNVGDLPKFRAWPTIRDVHFEPPQWVWHDRLLAFEPNLYTGDAGVGKTTLAENLAVATATGSPLLGANTRSMPVALLAAEDHYGPLRDNLKAIAQALGLVDHPGLDQIHVLSVKSDRVPNGHILCRISDAGLVEDTPFMRELVAPFLASFEGEVLWIVDPLSEFVAFNNLSDQACRALATNWLAGCCAINGGRVTALVNDHPSKASMASGAHYAGSVQLKAAFSLVATLIGKDWQGTGANRQRKLTFEVKKGRYAAEDSVDFYRNSSPAFTMASVPALDPRTIAQQFYRHVIERIDQGLLTGSTNSSEYGPGLVAQKLGVTETQVKLAGDYCRSQGWLVYVPNVNGKTPGGWRRGAVTPLFPSEAY